MPSYFYHLKFELYPYPSTDNDSSASPSKQKRTKEEEEERRRKIWLPEEGTDIFASEKWPRHKRVKIEGTERHRRGIGSSISPEQSVAPERATGGGAAVIDCGLARASHTLNEDEEQGITVRIPNEGNVEFPPPNIANIQRDQRIASKDWRFGRVRIESLDTREILDTNSNTFTGTNMDTPQRPRGESSSGGGNGINAGLAPEAAGVGRVTKARYEVVEGKNTEVGWGIVHLYRDGEETPELGNTEVVYTAGSEAQSHQRKQSTGRGVTDEDEDNVGEDCTTLCIPAVPSYLTPSDFLGFVGEKTREEVSHFRMVMTGRMNRYLVLMKFRDGNTARRWRKEWDGKVFNSMEVGSIRLLILKRKLILASARNMSCNLHQVHYLPNTQLLQAKYQFPRALPRSFHALILHILSETISSANAKPRRTSNMSRLSRANGRYIWSTHDPLPACIPLQLSPKMARNRLPSLPTYKPLLSTLLIYQYQYISLRSCESSLWQR
jgi:BRCA1-associated protein